MPSLGVYYCQQLTLSVCLSGCLSVCHTPSVASSFLFLDGIKPFLAVISPCAPLQNFFFNFWFRLPKAQNLLPKNCTKSPTSRLVWQIDQRCLGLPGGFRGWSIQWNHAKCYGPTLVAMVTKFGLGAEIQSPTGLFVCLSVSLLVNTIAPEPLEISQNVQGIIPWLKGRTSSWMAI